MLPEPNHEGLCIPVYHGKAFEFYSQFYGKMLKMLSKEVMRMIDILERSRVFETKDVAEQILI